MITGPNDAAGVVWALGESFFFLMSFIFTINGINSYYWCPKVTEGLRKGSADENGPLVRVFSLFHVLFLY